ncbi:MAG: hypothetical protein FJ284_10090 [Planctomycetes bacterium]|nr:hypothetical protein [Planctomycetota bacterium]MBM4057527.1 hypothetical protein [Planctomycetota bacterium]
MAFPPKPCVATRSAASPARTVAVVVALAAFAGSPPFAADGDLAVGSTKPSLPTVPAYWQVPPLPQAVIQGGAIPPGWQPQAVPYQGIGPDGAPITMYFAPTYVFTYQSGQPVLAVPQVNRRGWSGGQPATTTAVPTAGSWNYATTSVPPTTMTLPPNGVARDGFDTPSPR